MSWRRPHYLVGAGSTATSAWSAAERLGPPFGKNCLAASATGQIVSSAMAGVRAFCLLSDGALCFHAAPLADIGHVDQAIGADNGFAIHGRHSAATGWTFHAWFSAAMEHAVTGSGGIVTIR